MPNKKKYPRTNKGNGKGWALSFYLVYGILLLPGIYRAYRDVNSVEYCRILGEIRIG